MEQVKNSIERMEGRVIWTLAQMTMYMCNMNLPQGKTPFTVQDFLPKWTSDEPDLTEEEEMMAMNRRFDSFNAKLEGMGIK